MQSAAGTDSVDIERVIAEVAREGNGGIVNLPDVFLVVYRKLTVELTARYRVPTLYQYRYFVTSGGLISYGTDVLDQYIKAAGYMDRILRSYPTFRCSNPHRAHCVHADPRSRRRWVC